MKKDFKSFLALLVCFVLITFVLLNLLQKSTATVFLQITLPALNSNLGSLNEPVGFSDLPESAKKYPDSVLLQQAYQKLGPELDDIVRQTQKYLDNHRLYRPGSTEYGSDLQAIDYIEVALAYQVPLNQMLAVARLESHFGTNCVLANGNLTRPCKYKNVFSMGLDDSGNNWAMSSWKQGLEAFGKWYSQYQGRGFSDCQKWRIYNPNGDYCAKVLSVANSSGLPGVIIN